jgi:hypothetical protein
MPGMRPAKAFPMSDSSETTQPLQNHPVQCPHCGFECHPQETQCPRCGETLAPPISSITNATDRAQQADGTAVLGVNDSIESLPQVTLHFLPSGPHVPLSPGTPVILGRKGGVQEPAEVLDLTELHASELGVSRRHCLLLQRGSQVIVMDLGSTNGTYLNGERLPPHQVHAVTHGDRLLLGELLLIISISSIESE